MASLCHCTGCIRKNCGVCKACLESNGDCCLLRRCQRFAYSPESDEKWHLESRQLFPNNLQFNRPHAPQKEPPRHIILTIEEDDDTDDVNNHSIPILPKLISTLHEDVIVQRPPSFGYTCGTCSKCQIGACRLCLKCCNTARQERCPFLACEAVSYSINYINSMERNARQALRSNPERLTLLYDSLFGDDGFMTRQKAERQKEKETIYANMFGERGDTPNRQIMLRSRFPRTPITPDESPCGYDSWKFDMAKMTRCKGKIRKVAKKSRTPEVYASHKCRRCNRMCSSHPNIRGLCMGCSKTENVQTAGFHLKDKCGPIVGQKRKQSKTDPVFMQQSDNIEPRHNTPRSKFPPKRLFADEHAPLSNDKVTPIMSFQRKRHVQCRRCSIVTVCGLCIDCNRIENIHQIGSLLPPLQGDDIYSSRKAHLINYIQSSLKIAVQTMESKQMDGGAYACSSFEERSEPRKLKVKFADSSYSYMERLWRERDNPYLFGDSLLHRADSLVAGIDASPRCGNQLDDEENFRANDGGGPTRQFLSMFFRYLPRIAVTNKSYGTHSLFEETDNYLRPLCDDRIYRLMEDCYKLEETSIYRCYRALGRIIGFCILHQYHISHNVLSKIHRNYLLRGVSPKESYDISDLFYDLKDSMGRQSKEDDTVFDDLGALLDCESDKETDFERKLRDYAYEVYIEQNMIFLEAVREGMRLDVMTAETFPETFHPIHPSQLDELFFGTTTFDVEDLIAVLQPVYAGEDGHRVPDNLLIKDRLVIQKQALRKNGVRSKPEGAFVNVLRTLSRNSKDFLATFVLYVTGYEYLPATCTINIEFNYKEMPSNESLPVSHTCVHTLKLPGLAYDANEDLIREKLCMSLNYFKHSNSAFNMK